MGTSIAEWLLHLMLLKLITASEHDAWTASAGKSPSDEVERELLIDLAKRTILSKLNLKEQPDVEPFVSRTMLATALRLQAGEEGQKTTEDSSSDEEKKNEDQGQEYETIIFAEAECSNSSGMCFDFLFNTDRERNIEILEASVWLYVINTFKVRRKVTITYSLHENDHMDDGLFEKHVRLNVWRSGWHNITLAPLSYTTLSQGESRLRIKLMCPECGGALHAASIRDSHQPFVVVVARRGVEHLVHRRSLTCSPSSNMCCWKKFYVNFKEIGWHNWILQPEGYYMNYCKGECPPSLVGMPGLAASFHVAVYKLIKAHNPPPSLGSCCVATKLYPLSILYLDNSTNIVKKDIADMIVERCGCT